MNIIAPLALTTRRRRTEPRPWTRSLPSCGHATTPSDTARALLAKTGPRGRRLCAHRQRRGVADRPLASPDHAPVRRIGRPSSAAGRRRGPSRGRRDRGQGRRGSRDRVAENREARTNRALDSKSARRLRPPSPGSRALRRPRSRPRRVRQASSKDARSLSPARPTRQVARPAAQPAGPRRPEPRARDAGLRRRGADERAVRVATRRRQGDGNFKNFALAPRRISVGGDGAEVRKSASRGQAFASST